MDAALPEDTNGDLKLKRKIEIPFRDIDKLSINKQKQEIILGKENRFVE